MAYVPIDGPTVFAVGAVAKAAPLQQLDQNIDAVAAAQNPLFPGTPTPSEKHHHTGGVDGKPVNWLKKQPMCPRSASSFLPNHALWQLARNVIYQNITSGSSSPEFVIGLTLPFWVPKGAEKLTMYVRVASQNNIRLTVRWKMELDSAIGNLYDPDDYSIASNRIITTRALIIDMYADIPASHRGQFVRLIATLSWTTAPNSGLVAAWDTQFTQDMLYRHRWSIN